MTEASPAWNAVDAFELAKNIGWVILKIVAFFIGMYYMGVRLFPWLFARVAQTGSNELLTLFVVATALGIAYGSAELFGVSFALGAFFAGVVINESKLSRRVALESAPLQNIFAVLFFVSVGMLFDPSILVEQPLKILGVVSIILVGKSVAAFLIVLLFRYPLNTALTVSASLAQIGEFSFILAGLGVTLGLMPPEGLSLVLSGALLSITLNPLVFRLMGPVHRLLQSQPVLVAWLEQRAAAANRVEPSLVNKLREHVILVGYGRVGHAIARQLTQGNIPFVVIERLREHVDRLHRKGIPAICGDAALPAVLGQAQLGAARMLVIASPDPFEARRMLQIARAVNPAIGTVVRTHTEDELHTLQRQGVSLALMAERELARGMSHYILGAYARPTVETEPVDGASRP